MNRYADLAIRLVPRILTLIDRNPNSLTYGCGDRNFWHYKTADFPSGMYQLVALPLAMLYKYNFKGNIYCGKERVKEWSLAAIRYAAKSSHKDGSCDEFYPNERAVGATAISLAEMVRAYKIISEHDTKIEDFFHQRALWLIKNWKEPQPKANHIAVIALALEEVGFQKAAQRFAYATLKLQNENGAYREHGGEDFGYQTISISFLAQYWRLTKDKKVLESLKRAVGWIYPMIKEHRGFVPNTGSRNCNQLCLWGFAILRKQIPKAEEIISLWAKYNGAPACTDDRYCVDEVAPILELIKCV